MKKGPNYFYPNYNTSTFKLYLHSKDFLMCTMARKNEKNRLGIQTRIASTSMSNSEEKVFKDRKIKRRLIKRRLN